MPEVPTELKVFLDRLVDRYERLDFIPSDPISIPHGFDDPRDQEVIGLYAALLAWGRRATIMAKLEDLCQRMAYRPYDFVLHFDDHRADRLAGFKHRTFQPIDAYWLTRSLSVLLQQYGSVEALFQRHVSAGANHVGPAIEGFSRDVFSVFPETPVRLRKHLARPTTGSACKRLCLYLRWMVRPGPVDFGIWTALSTAQLVLPLDVHSGTHARRFGLLNRATNDWKAALALTSTCRTLHATDPARYDFAFFGAGASGECPDPPFTTERGVIKTGTPSSKYD